ncbi:hypothetical protein [Falsiroseomonas oryziterrae]|uniref:hypothetical protein n=1 Tax=Falsiroseomonas oryziterrae TaxID=2911368 RepID=UPI001F2D76DE|nr:hypothetical protein [Roseomonas sp. NPKOSM-4]
MLLDAAFAALVADRLGSRWRRAPDLVELDDHLRRDIGLAPRPTPVPRVRHPLGSDRA